MSTGRQIWVIDTSSVIQVRRLVPRQEVQRIYLELGRMVTDGKLVFPKRVVGELEEWANPTASAPDLPLDWAQTHENQAARFEYSLDYLKHVLAEVPDVIDPDKSGKDEADPHVLALAVYLRDENYQVTVVSEERKDYANKLSIDTACGLLGFPCVPLKAYLRQMGIPFII